MSFVDDDEIPPLLPNAFTDIVLLGVVDGCDDLGLPIPEIQKLLLVIRRMDDLKRFVEETQQFVLPLNS